MKHLTQVFAAFFWHLGGPGLLLLGILDSSFLFAPLGNDLLVVAMTAHTRSTRLMLYYSLMSTIGSVLGCLLIDIIFRKAGESSLEKHLSPKRLKRVQSKVRDKVGRALAIASLIPPPFPFTGFVMAASALQYSRKRLLAIVGVTRMIRFTVLGLLAMRFGERILKWSDNRIVQQLLVALIVICTVGSVLSVYGWIRRSR